jgi:hypothetical protein
MNKLIFYVSKKALAWPYDAPDVDAITAVALSRNASLDVTGALISTDHYFAQILEGPEAAVDDVMASILRDARHHSVKVLADCEEEERWFAQWSLAFAGRSSPVSSLFEPLLADPPQTPKETTWLMRMIQALIPPGWVFG